RRGIGETAPLGDTSPESQVGVAVFIQLRQEPHHRTDARGERDRQNEDQKPTHPFRHWPTTPNLKRAHLRDTDLSLSPEETRVPERRGLRDELRVAREDPVPILPRLDGRLIEQPTSARSAGGKTRRTAGARTILPGILASRPARSPDPDGVL